MKSVLRLTGVAIIIAAVGFWLATGGNRGWTKTSAPIKTIDDVTGIEGVSYHKKFVPGVDFLAVTVGLGFLCAGISFLFRTKPGPRTSNEQTSH